MGNDMWMTCPEFAKRYEIPYALVRRLAETDVMKSRGHWQGKQFRFNTVRCEAMYESGELDELINEIMA